MKKVRLAIADDHTLIRSAFTGLIERFSDDECQYERVLEAGNGQELLAGLNEMPMQDILDIVLLDLSMPEKDGFESIRALRSQFPDIKILVLTVRCDDYSIIRSIKLGASGYIGKDAEPAELKEAIDLCLARGFYLPGMVSKRLIRQLIEPFRSPAEELAAHPILTEREKEFLGLVCSELTYSQIAGKMGLSVRTIDGYRESLFARFSVSSRVGLVLWAVRNEQIDNIHSTTI